MNSARILMTGSRNWNDPQVSRDALRASLALLGATTAGSVLVHGAARGADSLLAEEARKLGMEPEAHPARWGEHTAACPAWDRKNTSCKLAGFRRNTAMIQGGADLCLAFPTHGYELVPGEDRRETSRGTWNCAEEAKNTGMTTLVVWGQMLFPFGDPALDLLRSAARRRGVDLGHDGRLPIAVAVSLS